MRKVLFAAMLGLGAVYGSELVRRLKPAMKWFSMAERIGKRYGLAPHLIVAVIAKESAGDMSAVGDNGQALGLMQVRPIAFRDVQSVYPADFAGVAHAALRGNAELQVKAGTAFLRIMFDRTTTELDAIDAYNLGERGAESTPAISAYAFDVQTMALAAQLWRSFRTA